MQKRIIGLLLCLVLCVSLMLNTVSAAAICTVEFTKGGNANFSGAPTGTEGMDYICTLTPVSGY